MMPAQAIVAGVAGNVMGNKDALSDLIVVNTFSYFPT